MQTDDKANGCGQGVKSSHFLGCENRTGNTSSLEHRNQEETLVHRMAGRGGFAMNALCNAVATTDKQKTRRYGECNQDRQRGVDRKQSPCHPGSAG